MIAELNRLVELVEGRLAGEIDVAELARGLGTTEYHLPRMFSSLAGMPLSEYIRRRRMTVAAADVRGSGSGELLGIAVRFGTGRRRRSGGRSVRCTASAPVRSGATVDPFACNRRSGSA